MTISNATAIVVDVGSVHLSDTDGADIIIQLAGELRSQETSLAIAHAHPKVLALWRRAGVVDTIGDDAVFESVAHAVTSLTGGAHPSGWKHAR